MIVVLNNKSNLDKKEFMEYQNELKKIESSYQLVICPSQVYLNSIDLPTFDLGSQNVSSYHQGAYTGEIYAHQLKSLDVKYCLVGHSERRKYQRETNKDINEKIKRLLEEEITPILCIGETKEQKDSKKTKSVLLSELNECLSGINNNDIIIAYEPIWAIGTGITPTKDEVEDVLKEIKKVYQKNKLIYGGSLNQENIVEFKTSYLIDGYLLGGLSLKPQELKDFISKIED
jgi:triose-phosphate isomerase